MNSVTGQDYRNLEIILVDDGSQDSSSEICDRYASLDDRIIVIHKNNGGLSSARNAGMTKMTGEFVMFIDSDDHWRDCRVVQELVNRVGLTHADVTSFSFAKFDSSSDVMSSYFRMNQNMPLGLNRDEQLAFLSKHGLYIASACNKLIRRSLLEEGMRFQEGVYSEDIDWCARLLAKAERFDFLSEALYCYRQHNASIRHTITEKKCQDLANGILSCLSISEKESGAVRTALAHYTAFQYGTFFLVQAQADREPEVCISQLEAYSWILKHHGNNRKLICLFVACKVLGFRRICRLIRGIRTLRAG